MTNTIEWLTGCPVNDINFRSHLVRATVQELEIALARVSGRPHKTTVRRAIEWRLKNLRRHRA